jgi:hypothetical protein
MNLVFKALLTLNSCPMFTFNGRDSHRNLNPPRINLPFQRSIGEILPERQKTEDDEVRYLSPYFLAVYHILPPLRPIPLSNAFQRLVSVVLGQEPMHF